MTIGCIITEQGAAEAIDKTMDERATTSDVILTVRLVKTTVAVPPIPAAT